MTQNKWSQGTTGKDEQEMSTILDSEGGHSEIVPSAPRQSQTGLAQTRGYGHTDHLQFNSNGSSHNHMANGSSYAAEFIVPAEERKRRRYTIWIIGVIIVCSTVFVVEMIVNNCPRNVRTNTIESGQQCVLPFLGRLSFQPLRENPLFGPSTTALQNMGALSTSLVRNQNQKWRLFTAIWLHAGVVHILCNMIAIFYIGAPLERDFGFLKIAVIYLLSGLGGSFLSFLFLINAISVGASGALFGLVGASLSELIMNWGLYSNRVSVFVSLLFVAAINLVLGLMPYVDNFAHLGGLISGFLLGFILLVKPSRQWEDQMAAMRGALGAPQVQGSVHMHSRRQQWLRLISVIVFLAGYITLIVVVFKGVDGNRGCSWCHYLSCVPTSLWTCPVAGDSASTQVVCRVFENGNGSGYLICSNASRNYVSDLASLSTEALQSLCSSLCG